MPSIRHANFNRAVVLSLLMMMMTQVGYLESMNPWTNGEETLDSNEVISHTSAATSVMYGNNSLWAPDGSQIFNAGDEMMAVTSDVVFYIGATNQNPQDFEKCLAAYNSSNMTRWIPNIAGRSNTCSSSVVGQSIAEFNFITQVDGLTFFVMKASPGRQQIHAYNPANDTVYLHDTSRTGKTILDSVAIGRTIYSLQNYPFMMTAYNIDNGSSWDISTSSQYFVGLNAVGGKILAFNNNTQQPSGPNNCSYTGSCYEPWIYDPANNTWFRPTRGNEIINRPIATSDSKALVTNGQMFWADTNYTYGMGAWVFDSSNNTYWMLDANASTGMSTITTGRSSAIRSGTSIFYLTRPAYSVSGQTLYGLDLWGYSTVNSSSWRLSNITELHQPDAQYGCSQQLAGLANGDFVMSFGRGTGCNTVEVVFYSLTNDTAWQVSGLDSPSDTSKVYSFQGNDMGLLGVYGNTVYLKGKTAYPSYEHGLIAYDATNGSSYSTTVTGGFISGITSNQPVLGNGGQFVFTMGSYTCDCNPSWADSSRYSFAVWTPTAITVSDAWNLTPGQRIDGPITGGLGGASDSGVGVQNLTASAEGAELIIDEAMTNITFQYNSSAASGSGGGSGGMTNVTGATCSVSPSLPTGLSIDSGTCTISGTPSVATTNTTYTVTAVMSGVTYQTTVWLSSAYLPLTPSVEGAELILDEAMTNITFQYNASAASGSGSGSGSGGMTNLTNATSCVASPSLPTGLSIDSSTCTISGTPTVATTNTTYTVTANISNVTYQPTVWLSSAYLPLTPSVEGAELILDEAMTNITFQYNSSAASGSGSGSNQSSFVNNIGLRTTSGSATQMINGTAITPIEFSLEWDNFSLPSNLSSNEKVTFPFDHSFNDTSSTPMENSTASNLTYDRHGREMHALDDEIEYGWSATNRSELAINSNTISLSLWVKPTNVGTVQTIIDNHPQYDLRIRCKRGAQLQITSNWQRSVERPLFEHTTRE